jgi:hypothetical protein
LLQHCRSNFAAEIGHPARLNPGREPNQSYSNTLDLDCGRPDQILMLQIAAA